MPTAQNQRSCTVTVRVFTLESRHVARFLAAARAACRVSDPRLARIFDADDGAEPRSSSPGLVVYRYDAPLFFANAQGFRRSALAAVGHGLRRARWFVLNVEANVEVDFTALEAVGPVRAELSRRGTIFALARVKQDLLGDLEAFGLDGKIGTAHIPDPADRGGRLPAMGQPARATRVVRGNALMPPLAGGVGRPAPAPASQFCAERSGWVLSRLAMCSTASRIVSPAAWAPDKPAAEIDVDPCHRRQGHGGIRGHRERDPRVQDRLGGRPQQRVDLRDGQLQHPLRNRAMVSICTCTGCAPCMAHLPSGRVVTGAADRVRPPGRHCPVTENRSRAAIRNGASRIAENCPPSCRVRWTISSIRSGTGCAAVPQSGQPSAATPSRPHRPHT